MPLQTGRESIWATKKMNPVICSCLVTMAGILQDKQSILQISRPFIGSGHECTVYSATFNSLNKCGATQVRWCLQHIEEHLGSVQMLDEHPFLLINVEGEPLGHDAAASELLCWQFHVCIEVCALLLL